jgi:hypothetical protein
MTNEPSASIRGQWWLPNRPNNKLFGVLSLSPEKRPVLETDGRLWESPWDNAQPGVLVPIRVGDLLGSAPIVLGITTQGDAITLIDSHETHSGSGTSTIVATYALEGATFECVEDVRLQGVDACLTHLDEWITDSGFAIEFPTTGGTRMVYQKPAGMTATLNTGFTLRIGFDVTGPTLKHPNTEFHMTQTAVACMDASSEATLDELLISLDVFRKFLSLAVGVPVEITMLRGRCAAMGPKRISIHSGHLSAENQNRTVRPDEMLFSLPIVRNQLQSLLQRWCMREKLLGPVYNLYTGTINSEAMYIEHRFTSFFQAIESYHRRTVPAPKQGAKGHRVSAKERVSTVIRNCDAQWLFTQPINEIVEHLVDVRDYFTHYLPEKDQHVPDPIDLYNDTVRLRLILEMALLIELGFSTQEIRKMFDGSRRLERLLVTKA